MTPKLKDLFVYPIERYIPPVAKVGDITEATMATELNEYVVTTPIERALTDFLEVYAESRTGPTDQIGVWISGFFGSGKSHFAKVLSYLLTNPTVEGRTAESSAAREIFIDRLAGSPRRHEIEGLLHRAGMLNSHVMMFNIKTEQDQTTKDESITEILYRRHLAERGLSTNPTVASLELSLIERGLYDAFRDEVERRRGNPWREEREDYLFIRSSVAEALQAVAPDAYHSREEALGALDMVDQSQRMTVSDLAGRLVDYVDDLATESDPERPPRLVFILDEVGQFIGTDDQKLLELQSIAHEFAIQGQGKLWLIVTAQAKLGDIIGGAERMDAQFGKIGDRFDTRLALTAEDVERVLEGRILQKKDERIPDIKSFYHDHEGALAVLSTLPGASRDLPPMTAEDFAADTPFLPYHPTLIQAIFGSVQRTAATGFGVNPEARSMIGMAQGVLSEPSNGFVDGELGQIVSIDMVYDRIAVDLPPQDKREIEKVADQLPGYGDRRHSEGLAQRVLKALYLLQSVPWIAVKAETLAHALIQDIHTENIGTLTSRVEASLQRLQEARYVVPKEGGVWEFLTGAKKSFEEQVSGVTVRQIELRRETRRMLGDVLRPVGKLNYKRGMRSFDVTVRGDGEAFESGEGIVLEVFSPLYRELEDGFSVDDLEQIESFAHPDTAYWVAEETPDLKQHVIRAMRLDEVLAKWQAKSSKTQEEREIVREKDTELNNLRSKIKSTLRVALTNGTIIWNGRAEPLDGRTSTLNPIFNRHVSQVVPHVYPKFDLAAVKPDEDAIEAVLNVAHATLPTVGTELDLFGEDGHLNQHSGVVEEVQQELKRRADGGYELTGKALEAHFTGGDYGWHPVIVRLVMAAMFRAGLVTVKADNVHYTDHTVPAAQKLFTHVRPFRRARFFYEEAVAVTPEELREAQDELKLIFDAPRREETANALAAQIQEQMEQWDNRVGRVVLQLRPTGYAIPEVLEQSRELRRRVTRFANPGRVVKKFLEHVEEVRDWHAEARALYDFVVRDKHLPDFKRAGRLLEEIERATGVPGTDPLHEEDAQRWRERLSRLIDSGRAAHEWEAFAAALTPLQERFREVYAALHQQRDEAVADAQERLESAGVPLRNNLHPYECEALDWDADQLHCTNCSAALKELPLQAAALPGLVRDLRERYESEVWYDEAGPRVKRIRLMEVLPRSRINRKSEIAEIVEALQSAIIDALSDADVVELE
jgi:hypothetical protein